MAPIVVHLCVVPHVKIMVTVVHRIHVHVIQLHGPVLYVKLLSAHQHVKTVVPVLVREYVHVLQLYGLAPFVKHVSTCRYELQSYLLLTKYFKNGKILQ